MTEISKGKVIAAPIDSEIGKSETIRLKEQAKKIIEESGSFMLVAILPKEQRVFGGGIVKHPLDLMKSMGGAEKYKEQIIQSTITEIISQIQEGKDGKRNS